MAQYAPEFPDLIADMKEQIAAIERRVTPTAGSSTLQATVDQLTLLVQDLQTQVANAIAANSYTQSQINNKVAYPGDINPGNVNASGSVSAAGNLTVSGAAAVSGILSSPASAATTWSTYRSTVWNNAAGSIGQLGVIPSILAAKTNLIRASVDIPSFLEVEPYLFQYIKDVEENGDQARVDRGFIAEHMRDAGFVEALYDDPETGELAGLNYDRLTPILWDVLQQITQRLIVVEQALAESSLPKEQSE